MILRQSAENFFAAVRGGQAAGTEALSGCLTFMVEAWIALSDDANANEFAQYRACDGQAIETLANRVNAAAKGGDTIDLDLNDRVTHLALLRFADEFASRASIEDDDRYLVVGSGLRGKLRPRSVTLSDPVKPYGAEFDIVRLQDAPVDPPARGQGSPLVVTMRHHRVFPRRIGDLSFQWSGFRGETKGEARARDKIDPPPDELIGYAGGYATARDWKQTAPVMNGKRMQYFAPTGGIHATRLEEIKEHIQRAVDLKARVIVLPELTICEETQDKLAYWLSTKKYPRDLVILPGTYHVQDKRLGRQNRAWLLRGDGVKAELPQYKLLNYQTATELELIDANKPWVVVNYVVGGTILNILICIDFCNADHVVLPNRVSGSVVLVPSMGNTKTVRSHVRRCEDKKVVGRPSVLIAQEMVEPKPKGKASAKLPSWPCVFDGSDVKPATATKRALFTSGILTTQ